MSAVGKWPNVQTDTIVEVWVPSDGLLGERLPADENIVGWLALENEFELGLQLLGGLQPGVAAGFARID